MEKTKIILILIVSLLTGVVIGFTNKSDAQELKSSCRSHIMCHILDYKFN